MSCERIAKLLSVWIDGELPASRSADVQAHLSSCAACERLALDLRQLRQVATELSDHELPPQLFAQSLAALRRDAASEASTASTGWGRRALAAGLGLAAVTGLVLAIVLPMLSPRARHQAGVTQQAGVTGAKATQAGVTRVVKGKRSSAGPSKAGAALPAPGSDEALLAAAGEEFRRAELHYRRALAKLHVIADRESGRWPPARKRGYERVLAQLDTRVRRCRSAAELSPADPKLQELLFSAYRRKIGYLRGSILGTLAGDGLPTLDSLPPVGSSETL
jgi:hypothetical protein